MMMERDHVAALEQTQLLKGNNDGPGNGSSLLPPTTGDVISSQASTYSTSAAPSTLTRGSIDHRKYSTGFDTRKYSSQLDPYRKYSSVSGYGGRSYLSPSSGASQTGTTSLAYGGSSNQHVPMIDDK